MVATSQTITVIPTTTYGTETGNYDGETDTFVSEPVKGDGYYGHLDGLHTVSYLVTDFVGSLTVQGTLSKTPTEDDWIDISLSSPAASYAVDTTGAVTEVSQKTIEFEEPTTQSGIYNFSGNLVWVRVLVTNFVSGTINFVQYRH